MTGTQNPQGQKTVRLRDIRKPRHGWFDYEVYDVFGDELGCDGLSVYMTLARLCYGNHTVNMGLRDMATHARMNHETFRRHLKRVVELGLVLEHKGRTAKSASSYDLVDVKELADEYLKAGIRQSVSPRDRLDTPRAGEAIPGRKPSHEAESPMNAGDAATDEGGTVDAMEASAGVEVATQNCLPGRQMGDLAICLPDETDLPQTEGAFEADLPQTEAHFEADLSTARRHALTQETRLQETRLNPPTPRGGVNGISPKELERWGELKAMLKAELLSSPSLGRFHEVVRGENDYDTCFRDWWLVSVATSAEKTLFATGALDPKLAEIGIERYRARLLRLARRYFYVESRQVSFAVVERTPRPGTNLAEGD